MYHKITCFLPIFLLFITLSTKLSAQETNPATICHVKDRTCILEKTVKNTASINNTTWRDQTYREIAKTYAFDGEFERAIQIISKIQTPDTKAMTIRGIGMTLAAQKHPPKELNRMFSILRVEAEKISHPASYAIALTYIAMAQAFANDNEGAWKTASDMKNDALRHKAYGETAEIQAEKGDFKSAQISIEEIDSLAFRNKAYNTVSRILSDHALFQDAYIAANAITNPYKKAQAIQHMLDKQRPRDVKH
ncbi:MAG: hypothetical protein COA45_00330 [Zetaproteobacteria bacterium]|nr:MAG: hypothetical protein COA45_00330 [Zetaproteobacteria bacterium]